MNPSQEPLLIALEGPAGAGKTSLQKTLCQKLLAGSIKAAPLPEFSESPLGNLLRENSGYGEAQSSWTVEVGGLFAFLADKVRLLENTVGLPLRIWVADRFLSSQLVLAVREIDNEGDRQFAREIISETTRWASQQFAEGSLVIFLEAPADVLAERLEQRLGRQLLKTQRKLLQQEVEDFRSLQLDLPRFKQIRIDSGRPIDTVASDIISLILPQWAR